MQRHRTPIRDELVVIDDHPILHRRVALVLPTIPDRSPREVREGIARRRITACTGRCPCGAVVDFGNLTADLGLAEIHHTDNCPAETTRLIQAVKRWLA